MDTCEIDDRRFFNVLSLPVELLVYILSFLPTSRCKVKLRYVSRRLRVVTDIPSLWSEFVWPFYDRREELSVVNVLKAYGMYIKRLCFPNHVMPSVLIQMLSHCNNVTQLCLPPTTTVDLEELAIAVEHMASLEKLEVQLSSDIEPLLDIDGLKEMTVHVPEQYHSSCAQWVEEWKMNDCVPFHFNLFTARFEPDLEARFLKSVLQRRKCSPLSGYTSCFKLFYKLRPPLGLFHTLPDFQVEIGQTIIVPSVKTENFGILGLGEMMLMDCTYDGKLFCKAEHQAFNMYDCSIPMKNVVTKLSCVTEFNFANSGVLNSGHLEQVAFACPNLQRLNLEGNFDCLIKLEGLRKIALHCLGLRGLSLKKISSIESHVGLWEVLSSMKLTHLAMDVCGFNGPLRYSFFCHRTNDNDLIPLFRKCTSLQALEFFNPSFYRSEACKSCEDVAGTDTKWLLLSHFPALKHCRLSSMHSNVLQDVINVCKELTVLSCNCLPQVISSVATTNLQQLYLYAVTSEIPNIFMDTVSAHGGLIHVVFFISSVTVNGIVTLVKNSPELLTLNIYNAELICNQSELNSISPEDKLQESLQKFSNRKLFNVGCRFVVAPFNDRSLCDILTETDFSLLWHYYT